MVEKKPKETTDSELIEVVVAAAFFDDEDNIYRPGQKISVDKKFFEAFKDKFRSDKKTVLRDEAGPA